MTPKPKAKPVINYPPITTRKWKPPAKDLPHDPHKKKKFRRSPQFPKTHKLHPSTLAKIWHRYKVLDGSVCILRGSYSQCSKRYLPISRGMQGPGNCVAAIAMAKLMEMSKWTTSTIDIVLENGNKLFLQNSGISKLCLQPKDINPIFFFDNTRFKMGIYHESNIKGRLFKEDDKDVGLLDAVTNFFVSGKSCVLEVGYLMVSVWRESGFYFYFDPGNTDDQGLRLKCKEPGCACIVKTHEIHDILARIIQNLEEPQTTTFVLTPVEVRNILPSNLKAPETLAEYEKGLGVQVTEGAAAMPGIPAGTKGVAGNSTAAGKSTAASTRKGGNLKKKEEVVTEEKVDQEMDDEGKPVVYPLERPRAPSVTYFQILRPDRAGIMRASHHQMDPTFSRFGGRQSGAHALSALATLRVHKSRTWTRPLLDGILCGAEKDYGEARRRLHGDANVTLQTLGNKIRTEVGTFRADVVDSFIHGKMDGGDAGENTVDLEQALEEFFSDNDTGIINGPIMLAVWLEDGRYYMFDPNERDEKGCIMNRNKSEFEPSAEKGYACLTWFHKLVDLVDLYIENLARERLRDYFTISKVEIKDYVELPESWNNFKSLELQKWILRGTISQNNMIFSQASRNTQCTVNATVSICYKTLKAVESWEREDVDKILMAGDKLYNETVTILKDKNKFKDSQLYPSEIPSKFKSLDQEFVLEMKECTINGVLSAPDDSEIRNMKTGLSAFFSANDSGVITANHLTVAVWRGETDYFYFDSHGRSEDGYYDPYGTACVLRFTTLEEVACAIHANLRSAEPSQYNMFNMTAIVARIVEVTDTGVKRVQLDNFVNLADSRAIVRAGGHEGSAEKWDIHANKQTYANLFVAAGMVKVYPPCLWNSVTLDEILNLGHELYLNSRAMRIDKMELARVEGGEPLEEDFDPNKVDLQSCIKQFMIGLNFIAISFNDPVPCMVEPLDPTLDMPREEAVDTDLKTFLEENFVNENEPCQYLLETETLQLCIWRDINYYYLFDPKGRDGDGLAINKDRWSIPVYKRIYEEGEGEYDEAFESFPDQPRPEVEGGQEEGDSSELARARRIYSGLDWSDARACALAVSSIDEIVTHVKMNVPPRKRVIPITLRKLEVGNNVKVKIHTNPIRKSEGDWHNFKEIELDRWILRATLNLEDTVFPAVNRGLQHIAMAVAGALLVQLYTISVFDTKTVDKVIKYGDKLHTVVVRQRIAAYVANKDLEFTNEELVMILRHEPVSVDALPTHLAIGNSTCRFECVQVLQGDVTSKPAQEILNIPRSLTTFFESNKYGMVVAKGIAVGVFKHADKYFMFDPCSRGPSGFREDSGVACFTRFTRLEDLTNLLQKNLPKEGINTFKVYAVNKLVAEKKPDPPDAEPQVQAKQEITPFQKVDEYMRILHGSTHQNDPRFGKRLNTMSATNAVVAIAMAFIHKALTWTRPIVDEVLILARRLYDKSSRDLGYSFNPWFDDMTLAMVTRQFTIGTHLAQVVLLEGHEAGKLYIKDPNVKNLRYCCERFFRKNDFGIIESQPLTVAAWRDRCWYFLFDPNPRGKTGLFLNSGCACLMAFKTPVLLAEHFLKNVAPEILTADFTITAIDVELSDAGVKKQLPQTKTDVLNVKKIEKKELQEAGDILLGKVEKTKDESPKKKKSPKKPHGSPKKLRKSPMQERDIPRRGKMQPTMKSPPKVIPRKHPTYQMPRPVMVSEAGALRPCAEKIAAPSRLQKPRCMLSDPSISEGGVSRPPSTSQPQSRPAEPRKRQESRYAPQAQEPEEQKVTVRQHVEEKKMKAGEALLKKMRQELTPIGEGVKILRCRISQLNMRYPEECRGKQALCNACVALAMARLHPVLEWSGANLEVVLDSASMLHLESRMVFKDSSEYLSLRHVARTVNVAKLRLYLRIYKPLAHARADHDAMLHKFGTFFNLESKGIFQCGNIYIAIFRTQLHQYLMFQPWPRDEQGLKITRGTGSACLLYFPDLSGLIQRILSLHDDEITPSDECCLIAMDTETEEDRAKRRNKEKENQKKYSKEDQ